MLKFCVKCGLDTQCCYHKKYFFDEIQKIEKDCAIKSPQLCICEPIKYKLEEILYRQVLETIPDNELKLINRPNRNYLIKTYENKVLI